MDSHLFSLILCLKRKKSQHCQLQDLLTKYFLHSALSICLPSVHTHTLGHTRTHIRTISENPSLFLGQKRLGVSDQGPLLLSRHSKKASLPDMKRLLYNLLEELSQSSDYFLTRKWKKKKIQESWSDSVLHLAHENPYGLEILSNTQLYGLFAHRAPWRKVWVSWHSVFSLPCKCAIPFP